MIFLIATVFIAQLVLLVNIVICLTSINNRVLALSEQITVGNIKLESNLRLISQIISDFNNSMPDIAKKITKKRNNILIVTLSRVFQSIVLIFCKPKYKKLLIGLKIMNGVLKDLSKK